MTKNLRRQGLEIMMMIVDLGVDLAVEVGLVVAGDLVVEVALVVEVLDEEEAAVSEVVEDLAVGVEVVVV